MKTFIYDNSFEGLFSAVYDAYYSAEKPARIVAYRDYEMNFLYEEVHIVTDQEKYTKVSNAIRNKISALALEYIYHAYLSELPDISMQIYEYIRLGFHIGHVITQQHANDLVKRVHSASYKATAENHRLLGLLRFKRVKGDIYYASIRPDHNVLPLLAPHFQDRLSDQRWIIHDLKRSIAAVYDKDSWVLQTLYHSTTNQGKGSTGKDDVSSSAIVDPNDKYSHHCLGNGPMLFNPSIIKDADIDYENLWRLYHKHISIETKRNIRLQKQYMPSRYWVYLPEKKYN